MIAAINEGQFSACSRSEHPLTESEQATLAAVIFKGPKPEGDGVCTWTREALAIWISAKFGKTLHPGSLSRILRRMGMSRQKALIADAELLKSLCCYPWVRKAIS